MRKSEFSIRTQNYPLGTAWLRFHTNVRLLVGGVIGSLYGFAYLLAMLNHPNNRDFFIFITTIGIISAAILSFTAFVYTRRLTYTGYILNIALFGTLMLVDIVLICKSVYLIALDDYRVWDYFREVWFYTTFDETLSSLFQGVFSFVLNFIQIVYFWRRKSLFQSGYEPIQPTVPAQPPMVRVCLSSPSETPKTYGNYNVRGEDIALETAPVQRVAPKPDTRAKAISDREKAFAQIAVFHDYYQRGIITEEEYLESKKLVMEGLDDSHKKLM